MQALTGDRVMLHVYVQKVKDSWRIVNHRDIIPTVPRLMGYCHVAQPVYLAAGGLRNALVGIFLLLDKSSLFTYLVHASSL